MKRTKYPHARKLIGKQDIEFSIIDDPSLCLEITRINLSKYNFNSDARIFVEIYDRMDFYRFEIKRKVKDLSGELDSPIRLDFPYLKRKRFRLKVVNPKTSHLLGLVENLKEKGFQESFFPMEYVENINGLFKISWEDHDSPILQLNKKLEYADQETILPIIVEFAFKEVVTGLLDNDELDYNDLEECEWEKFVNSLGDYSLKKIKKEKVPWSEQLEEINAIVGAFSSKHKIVDSIPPVRGS